jgi:SAM-dependent methyltransferase
MSDDLGQQWRRCKGCTSLFRSHIPSNEELAALYETAWGDPLLHKSETGGTVDVLATAFARELSKTIGRDDFDGMRILDFGAGRGAAMQAMKQAGAHVVGVEPNGWESLRKLGFEAYPDIRALPSHSIPFDGIVCYDVIEHLLDPEMQLLTLRALLKPGGWLVVATPNARSLRARVRGSDWEEARKVGHLMLFSPTGLEQMFRRAGYADVRRLRWVVVYSDAFPRRALHALLRLTAFDGELRLIGWAR